MRIQAKPRYKIIKFKVTKHEYAWILATKYICNLKSETSAIRKLLIIGIDQQHATTLWCTRTLNPKIKVIAK